MTDRILALSLAGELAMAYPGRTVTEDHARSWAAEFGAVPEPVARRAAALLRNRSMDPPAVAQVRQAIREASGTTMSPDIEYTLAGAELPQDVLAHGIYHLRRYLSGRHDDEWDATAKPWDCTCERAS